MKRNRSSTPDSEDFRKTGGPLSEIEALLTANTFASELCRVPLRQIMSELFRVPRWEIMLSRRKNVGHDKE